MMMRFVQLQPDKPSSPSFRKNAHYLKADDHTCILARTTPGQFTEIWHVPQLRKAFHSIKLHRHGSHAPQSSAVHAELDEQFRVGEILELKSVFESETAR